MPTMYARIGFRGQRAIELRERLELVAVVFASYASGPHSPGGLCAGSGEAGPKSAPASGGANVARVVVGR